MAALSASSAHAAGAFARALATAKRQERPFRHWLLKEALDAATMQAFLAAPIPAPEIVPTQGRRETNNGSRVYVTPATRRRHSGWNDLAAAFQAPETLDLLETVCEARLRDTYLRIEYCQDVDGFWLEPHTDIAVKRITILVYLSGDAGDGTDLFHADMSPAGRAPFAPGLGLIFVPASDTWHGYLPRPIRGVRRSLIINYVSAEWRARYELAFPDRPASLQP